MYEKRLIAFVVSFLTLGVAVGISINNHTLLLCAAFAIVSIASVAFLAVFSKNNKFKLSKYITAAVIAVAALSFGIVLVCIRDGFDYKFKNYDKKSDVAKIEIIEINNTHIDGKIKESQLGVSRNSKVRLYTSEFDDSLIPGDIISCEVKYNFTNTRQLRAKGIVITATANIIDTQNGSGLLYVVRKSVSENSSVLFERFDNAASISKGVTIGDRSDINSYIFALYRNSGISHLLAISGLHISIIVLSFYNFLLKISINKKVASILSVFVAILFASLTGFSVGALRSAVMISVVLILGMFFQEYDSFTSLFGTLLLFILLNPYSIYSLSLQLSFLCVFGLLLTSPFTNKISFALSLKIIKSKPIIRLFYRILSFLAEPIITSTIASIFSFPVIFFNFDSTSSVSPLINVFAIPLFTIAVEFSVIAYLIAPLSTAIASFFAYPAGFIYQAITDISQFVYEANFGVVSIHTPFIAIPLVVSALTIWFLIFTDKSKTIISVVSCIAFSVSIFVCGIMNEFNYNRVNIVEYGNNQGEYIFCSTENNNIYIDIGGYSVNPIVVYDTGNVLLENYVILEYTPYTYRHIEYMTSQIRVKKITLPRPNTSNDLIILERINLLANERNCDIIFFDEDYRNDLSESVSLEIIGNDEAISHETSVYISYGKTSVQFLGDGFDNFAVCDYVILLKDCKTDIKNINANRIYVQKELAEENSDGNDISSFDERLKIEFNSRESGCRIYEP